MRPRGFLVTVVSLAPLAVAAQAPAPSGCEHIQLRFVDTVYQLGIDAVPTNAPRVYRNSANGWSYALNDTVVLDDRAIMSVGVQSERFGSEEEWDVFARTTIAGAKGLSDATATHVGRYLGILIGDDLVDTPRIDSRLSATFVSLRLSASRAVADSLLTRAFRAIGAGCVVRNGRSVPMKLTGHKTEAGIAATRSYRQPTCQRQLRSSLRCTAHRRGVRACFRSRRAQFGHSRRADRAATSIRRVV